MKHICFSTIIVILMVIIVGNFDESIKTDAQNPSFEEVLRLSGRGTPQEVTWSPDGNTIATSGKDGIWLYDTQLEDVEQLDTDDNYIHIIAWSLDGSKIAGATGDDGTLVENPRMIYIWDSSSHQVLLRFSLQDTENTVKQLLWSPNGNQLVVSASGATANVIDIWDIESGQRTKSVTFENVGQHNKVEIFWSNSNNHIAYTYGETQIWIWAIEETTSPALLVETESPISSIQWSENSISGIVDDVRYFWDIDSGDVLETSADVEGIISPDGLFVAQINRDTVTIFDRDTQTVIDEFQHTSRFPSFSEPFWSADSHYLIAFVHRNPATIYVWDALEQQLLHTIQLRETVTLADITINTDGIQLLTSALPGTLQIWDIATGELLASRVVDMGTDLDIAWSPDSQFLAVGGIEDSVIHIWDTATGDYDRMLDGEGNPITTVDWSPDNRFIAAGEYDQSVDFPLQVHVWDTTTGELTNLQVETSENISDAIVGLKFSNDGRFLAANLYEDLRGRNRIYIWDTSTSFVGPTTFEISSGRKTIDWNSHGTLMFSGFDFEFNSPFVGFWDAETHESQRNYNDTYFGTFSWRPNSTLIGLVDNTTNVAIAIWDITTNETVNQLLELGYYTYEPDITWNPDGSLLTFEHSTVENILKPRIEVWQITDDGTSGKHIATLTGHQENFAGTTALAWSPDGRFLASAGGYGDIIVWEYTD